MFELKLKSRTGLVKILSALRKRGKKIVFTNGCFDILHYGHIKYLQDTKKKGDYLVVAVNSDSSVKKIKGKNRPIVTEKDRLRQVAGLESVDFVILFKEENPLNLIKTLKPDILVKGADWKKKNIIGKDEVQSYGGKVFTVKLVNGRSTTALIKRILRNN
jgi:rfaE bifunctional protein nucleotidyltransferase chain/domain